MVGTMKHHHYQSKEDSLTADAPALDISSLIDVCFLLLIFFLVTTTIQPREQDLETTVPATLPDHPRVILEPMLIEVRQGGEVVVNPGDPAEVYDAGSANHELPNLTERLHSMADFAGGDVPGVLLRVHDEVLQQRYIDVLNCLAGAGIRDIAIQD
jgi:biopolymer transport protein ExbD